MFIKHLLPDLLLIPSPNEECVSKGDEARIRSLISLLKINEFSYKSIHCTSIFQKDYISKTYIMFLLMDRLYLI